MAKLALISILSLIVNVQVGCFISTSLSHERLVPFIPFHPINTLPFGFSVNVITVPGSYCELQPAIGPQFIPAGLLVTVPPCPTFTTTRFLGDRTLIGTESLESDPRGRQFTVYVLPGEGIAPVGSLLPDSVVFQLATEGLV